MTHRKSPRRGLVLLIVLGMLALFSLLAVTYVVFSSQSKTASVVLANSAYRGTNSSTLMNQVLKQVVRGTQDTKSPLWGQSILDDLYGPLLDQNGTLIQFANSGVHVGNWPSDMALVRNQLPSLVGTQYIRFPVRLINDLTGGGGPIPTEEDSFRNRIITFVEGPLNGMSFRVVRHVTEDASGNKLVINPSTSVTAAQDLIASQFAPNARVMDQFFYIDYSDAPNVMVPIPGTPPRLVPLHEAVTTQALLNGLFYRTAAVGYRFFVNPVMRSGTGYGRQNAFSGEVDQFQQAALSVAPSLQSMPVALLNDFGSYRTSLPHGGADEPYDAADYNNFFLSFSHGTPTSGADVIPSFHRPEVINYLASRLPSTPTPRDVLRLLQLVDYATARPLSLNIRGVNGADYDPQWLGPLSGNTIVVNPAFASANPGLFPFMTPYLELNLGNSLAPGSPDHTNLFSFLRWLAYGPWDVDTDGDGLNDSIWIDPNLPMITSSEGKLLKPLVALKIEDLDGRVNINAAGAAAQVQPSYTQATDDDYSVGSGRSIAQGFGYGPAELSLFHLFPNSATAAPYLNRLDTILRSRYVPRGGVESSPSPGQEGNDLVARFQARERWGRFVTGSTLEDYRHGRMPSIRLATHGEEGIGIDRHGQPLMLRGTTFTENVNSPYETRLLSEGLSDTTYDLEELERLIRVRDRDYSMLPNRLENALGGAAIGLDVRNSVTTRSVDLTDVELPTQDSDPRSPTHPFRLMVRQLLSDRGLGDIPEGLFHQLFPFEFRRGMRMDINRAFGDGIDNDGDGQIDEWDEWAVVGANHGSYPSQLERYFDSDTPTEFPVRIDQYLVDTPRAGMDPGSEPKQLFARELYCLAQLVVPSDYVFTGSPDASANNPATRLFRARKLAQWAVNVVDYRDSDLAMTRFAYDPNPFDGWNPGPGEVVWGMEQPELLLRESIAFHNYNVKDTVVDDDKQTDMNDTDMAKVDDDPDQYKLPQGGLLLELFAPRTLSDAANDLRTPGVPAWNANNPLGLFRRDGSTNQAYLDLGALAPAPANPALNPFGRQPVWRVVISTMHEKQGMASPNAVYSGSAIPRGRNDITYQLYTGTEAAGNGLYYNVADPSAPTPQIERIIWFTTQAQADPASYTRVPGLPATASPREHVFFNRTGVTRLEGGSHLLIGPRPDMRFGSISPNTANEFRPSRQRIQLSASTVNITNLDGTGFSVAPPTFKPITGMVVAALPPNNPAPPAGLPDWPDIYPEYGAAGGIGINISEPLPRANVDLITNTPVPDEERYYRLPRVQLNSTSGSGYDNDPKESWHDFATAGAPWLPDEPFDRTANMLPPRMHNVGTYRDVTTAFLQRLADPEREYDAVLNPYITVDWIPIDLTTFSGEDDVQGISPGATITDPIHFTTRSRSGHDASGASGVAGNAESTLYTYATIAPNNSMNGSSQVPVGTPVFFDHQLVRPIMIPGILDHTNSPPMPPMPATLPSSTLGFLNKEFGVPMQRAGVSVYDGHPFVPYATHFWLNRSFANIYELMMVPTSHPGQFNQEFTLMHAGADPAPTDPLGRPFGHLMNFFSTTQLNNSGVLDFNNSPGADIARLLDLLETPPPFVDSTKYVSPTVSANVPELSRERPPFNFMSTFRAPGKININTIPSAMVWKAIEANYLPGDMPNRTNTTTRFWAKIEESRRGYAPTAGNLSSGLPPAALRVFPNAYNVERMNGDWPTQFAGVFRSAWHSQFSPELPGSGAARFALRKSPAAATLLRVDPTSPNQPLLFDTSNNQSPNRYPFTAYQSTMRLPNLVTTHSNVFSVRMTMGYFEYNQLDRQLGREYRSDVGRAERNNAFFIIDRSVPVGFYPGIDLNSDKTVLIRRYFE